MAEIYTFYPLRTTGFVLHALLVLLILGGFGVAVFLTFQQQGGLLLVLFLLAALVLISLLPFAVYRVYALLHAHYSVERDGLRVRWGLRSEDVPLTEVIWVRRANELEDGIRLPRFSFPGAILGNVEQPGMGRLEFIASSLQDLVIVAAANETIVLSPQDPDEFVRKFQRVIEMGSLAPISPHTAVPAIFLKQVTSDHVSRILLPLGAGLTILLMVLTGLLIPSRQTISLGFDPTGLPAPPVASNRILLLPILTILFALMDLILGFYFFRRTQTRVVSYFIWGAGVICVGIFILSVLVLFLGP